MAFPRKGQALALSYTKGVGGTRADVIKTTLHSRETPHQPVRGATRATRRQPGARGHSRAELGVSRV